MGVVGIAAHRRWFAVLQRTPRFEALRQASGRQACAAIVLAPPRRKPRLRAASRHVGPRTARRRPFRPAGRVISALSSGHRQVESLESVIVRSLAFG